MCWSEEWNRYEVRAGWVITWHRGSTFSGLLNFKHKVWREGGAKLVERHCCFNGRSVPAHAAYAGYFSIVASHECSFFTLKSPCCHIYYLCRSKYQCSYVVGVVVHQLRIILYRFARRLVMTSRGHSWTAAKRNIGCVKPATRADKPIPCWLHEHCSTSSPSADICSQICCSFPYGLQSFAGVEELEKDFKTLVWVCLANCWC